MDSSTAIVSSRNHAEGRKICDTVGCIVYRTCLDDRAGSVQTRRGERLQTYLHPFLWRIALPLLPVQSPCVFFCTWVVASNIAGRVKNSRVPRCRCVLRLCSCNGRYRHKKASSVAAWLLEVPDMHTAICCCCVPGLHSSTSVQRRRKLSHTARVPAELPKLLIT